MRSRHSFTSSVALLSLALAACGESPTGLQDSWTPPRAGVTVGEAVLIDFEGVGDVGELPPVITAGGVSVTFEALEVAETGGTTNGFQGPAGPNDVIVQDRANFGGRFLTAAGFGQGEFRPDGFVRTISFDSEVTDVELYVADIDIDEGITANAVDESGATLETLVFPGGLGMDGRTQLVSFGELQGIRALTLVGNDPVGIDNLSFAPVSRAESDQELMEEIQALVDAGVLSRGQGNALLSKLERALELGDAGRSRAAAGILAALLNQVEALVRGGVLTPEQGGVLVELAEALTASMAESP